MEEKIELNAFLNRLVSILNNKLESIEGSIKELKGDIQNVKDSQGKEDLKLLEEKLRKLEISVDSMKNKGQIDKSILKLLESEEKERKSETHGRRF